ncbi:MAG: hypothetical protein FWH05_07420 [Oscillospiraceae bacterium]|nr:hypothetical protein [Oscillospiraceae bacterium]
METKIATKMATKITALSISAIMLFTILTIGVSAAGGYSGAGGGTVGGILSDNDAFSWGGDNNQQGYRITVYNNGREKIVDTPVDILFTDPVNLSDAEFEYMAQPKHPDNNSGLFRQLRQKPSKMKSGYSNTGKRNGRKFRANA